MQEKCYTFVYMGPMTDEGPKIEYLTKEKIKKFVKANNQTFWDYAIIDGPILKSFHSKFSLEDL